MASCAIGAERTRVNIIATVAAAAGSRQRDCGRSCQWALVAAETFEAFVGAVEHELGLRVVIELPDQPIVGVVARLTIESEATLVNIVFPMTVHALIRRVVERRAHVAGFAGYGRMQSQQWEEC